MHAFLQKPSTGSRQPRLMAVKLRSGRGRAQGGHLLNNCRRAAKRPSNGGVSFSQDPRYFRKSRTGLSRLSRGAMGRKSETSSLLTGFLCLSVPKLTSQRLGATGYLDFRRRKNMSLVTGAEVEIDSLRVGSSNQHLGKPEDGFPVTHLPTRVDENCPTACR